MPVLRWGLKRFLHRLHELFQLAQLLRTAGTRRSWPAFRLRRFSGSAAVTRVRSASCVRRIMMYALYIARRTQIYLNDDQDRQLAERARQLGRTKSALIRDAIDAYLSPATNGGSALAALRAAVKDAAGAAPYLPAGVDYVTQLRAVERERRSAIDRRR